MNALPPLTKYKNSSSELLPPDERAAAGYEVLEQLV
jgi:hypothetical protein